MPNCHCPFMCRVQDSDIFYIQRRQTLNKLYESLLCILKGKIIFKGLKLSYFTTELFHKPQRYDWSVSVFMQLSAITGPRAKLSYNFFCLHDNNRLSV